MAFFDRIALCVCVLVCTITCITSLSITAPSGAARELGTFHTLTFKLKNNKKFY